MDNTILDINFINVLKKDPKELLAFLENESNNGKRIFLLERLGRLEKSFNKKPLLGLLIDPNDTIRFLAVKNLAKLCDLSLLDNFYYLAVNDTSSIVRREAVSGIGRLRSRNSIPYLSKLLNDNDPKIVMQAIRGLIVFKNDNNVLNELLNLKDHPNEMIRDFIKYEVYKKSISRDIDHAKCNPNLVNTLIKGDVLEILRHVPDDSIHLTFTSPPYYNARDYSIYESYKEYLLFLDSVFSEVYRITKDGRFFVLNTSPIIIPRISRSHSSKRYPIPFDIHGYLIKMGWEFIDDIVWLKPEASVKNRNAGFLQHRKPLAYKPNAVTEMIMVYRKNTGKLIDWNIHQYDTEIVNKSRVKEDYETTNVWRIDPTFDKIHSAVFPMELCNRVIKFYSMVGDLIFDPFAGSGTVGKSAINNNRKFLMTEIDESYFNYIKSDFENFKNTQNNKKYNFSYYSIDEFKKRMAI